MPSRAALLTTPSSELVINGGFDQDLVGWTNASAPGASVAVVGGQAVNSNSAAQSGRLRQQRPTVPGRIYSLTATGANWTASVGTTSGGTDVLGNATAMQTRQFTATSALTWLNFSSTVNGAALDNVSCKLVYP